MDRRCAAVVSMCLGLAGCRDDAKPLGHSAAPSGAQASTAAAAASLTASAAGSASAAPTTSATASPSSTAAVAGKGAGAGGGGEGDCKVVRGPVRLATRGAVAMGPGANGLLTLGTNKLGAPAWEAPRFPDPPKQGAASLLPRTTADVSPEAPSTERTPLPACAIAGGFSFCADADGAIHRRPMLGEGDTIVAKGRRGTPVAAAALGAHTFYAFLANQKTSEGVIVRAFAALDDETPIPISEDGSGATFVGLVARDRDVLAMYIDARTALTPIHARTLRAEEHLVRGTDAVVFIAAGADGLVRGALGRAESGPAFLFVPGPHDDRDYGMVTVVIDGEPKDDLPGKWSLYPTAMSSAYLAATSGKSPLRLVRSRPENKDFPTPQVLELGHVEPDGVFREKCVLAKASVFSDVTTAVDEKGSLWVAYSNGEGTWVEQRGTLRAP